MKTLLIILALSAVILAVLFATAPVYEQLKDGSWRKVEKQRRGKLSYKNDKYLQDQEQLTKTYKSEKSFRLVAKDSTTEIR